MKGALNCVAVFMMASTMDPWVCWADVDGGALAKIHIFCCR